MGKKVLIAVGIIAAIALAGAAFFAIFTFATKGNVVETPSIQEQNTGNENANGERGIKIEGNAVKGDNASNANNASSNSANAGTAATSGNQVSSTTTTEAMKYPVNVIQSDVQYTLSEIAAGRDGKVMLTHCDTDLLASPTYAVEGNILHSINSGAQFVNQSGYTIQSTSTPELISESGGIYCYKMTVVRAYPNGSSDNVLYKIYQGVNGYVSLVCEQ